MVNVDLGRLSLSKPLVFFDLETTGLNIGQDRIVEFAGVKVHPDGSMEEMEQRLQPGIPIPAEVSKIHGIYDVDLVGMPTLEEFAPRLIRFFDQADLAGYNSAYFDLPFLMEELLRIDIDLDISNARMVDVQAIFHKKEPRDLKAALRFYCGEELVNAHSAAADARATCLILLQQLNRYEDLQGNVDFLHRFTARNNKSVDLAGRIVRNDKGVELFAFGKYKGQSVSEVFARDPSYYAWMMDGDFPRHTKKVITGIRLRAMNTDGGSRA
ncbi:MAG: 3'-5' exonuclease [Sphingomonadales bacterium]|nr:3'-5' exonuclease [Sphingomonadales bacterium]